MGQRTQQGADRTHAECVSIARCRRSHEDICPRLHGEGALFDGHVAPRIRDVTDGTSNTILAILAAPETAEVWTKPGGLDVDPFDAADAIGLTDNATPVLFADGSVHQLTADIDSETLGKLIQHQDGQVVRFNERQAVRRTRSPVLFLRTSQELNRKRVLEGLLGGDHVSVKKDVEDLTVHVSQGLLVAFAGDNTVLAGPEDVVTGMLKKPASGPAFEVLKDMPDGELQISADLRGLDVFGAASTAHSHESPVWRRNDFEDPKG